MNPVLDAIESCREVTSRMLGAARSGDWQQVRELDERRAPCFAGVDVAELDPAALDSALEGFRALMAMDGHLRDLAALARRESLEALRTSRGRQQASSRYRELSAPR